MNEYQASMTETELVDSIIQLAKLHGWLVYHQRPMRTQDGQWRTGVQGDKGLPDLILARDGVVWFFECKSEKGTLSEEQKLWYHALPHCLVVKPEQWYSGEIEVVLTGKKER